MRRTVSAILLIAVFTSLQFGKVATYLYCKWQAEIVLNDPHCDCDDHLVSLFDQKKPGSNNDLSKISVNEKLNEFTPKEILISSIPGLEKKKNFTEYISPLADNFLGSPFHPPIV